MANPLSGMGNCSLYSSGRGSLFPSLHSSDTHPQAGIFLMPYQFQQAEIKLNCLKASVCLTFRNPHSGKYNSPHLFWFFFSKPSVYKKACQIMKLLTSFMWHFGRFSIKRNRRTSQKQSKLKLSSATIKKQQRVKHCICKNVSYSFGLWTARSWLIWK